MRILFIGAVEFSARTLTALIQMNSEIVGVCTLEKSPFNADHEDLTPIAHQAGIPSCYTPDINNSKTLAWIEEKQPDVIFCFGWSKLLKKPLLEIVPLGVIGYHPALLPQNRGRHPLIWALVLGLSETGSTFFFMDEGPDSGAILSQRKIEISSEDDAQSLYNKTTAIAIEQIRDFLPDLVKGTYKRHPQAEGQANSWRKRGKPDGRIDWRMSAEAIHNLVRGLGRPYIGAHFDYGDQEIKVWRTEIENPVPINLEPGKILRSNSYGVLVKTGSGAVQLCEIEPQVVLREGVYL
jgi:methionyl-tRNA formyltransferase